MKKTLYSILLVSALALLLVGCGSKDNTLPPAPLTKITQNLPVKTIWSTTTTNGSAEQFLALGPAVINNMAVSVGYDGKVVASNLASGKTIWQVKTKLPLRATPTISAGRVFVGSMDGKLLVLDANNGKHLWQATLTSSLFAKPAVSHNVVVVHVHDGHVMAFNATTGKKLWQYAASMPPLTYIGDSAPAIYNDTVIVGFDNGELMAFDLRGGQIKWEKPVALPANGSAIGQIVSVLGAPVVKDSVVYAVSVNGNVVAINATDGKLIWQHPMSSNAGLVVADNKVVVTGDMGYVWALDKNTGKVLWVNKTLKSRSVTAPAAIGGYVLVGDYAGYIHWLGADDGEVLARTHVGDGAIEAAPVVFGNLVFVTTEKGKLMVMEPFAG